MPEGDTIHTAANRVGAALVNREIESIETPHPRFGKERWADRLDQQTTATGIYIRHEGATEVDPPECSEALCALASSGVMHLRELA